MNNNENVQFHERSDSDDEKELPRNLRNIIYSLPVWRISLVFIANCRTIVPRVHELCPQNVIGRSFSTRDAHTQAPKFNLPHPRLSIVADDVTWIGTDLTPNIFYVLLEFSICVRTVFSDESTFILLKGP